VAEVGIAIPLRALTQVMAPILPNKASLAKVIKALTQTLRSQPATRKHSRFTSASKVLKELSMNYPVFLRS